MYLKKAWYLKTYMDTNGSIIFEKSYIKSKTNGSLVLIRHKSSLKTIEFQFSHILLKLKKQRVVDDAR